MVQKCNKGFKLTTQYFLWQTSFIVSMAQTKENVIYLSQSRSSHVVPVSFTQHCNEIEGSPYYYQMYYMPAVNEEEIEKCVKYLQAQGKDCVISFNETTSFAAAVINKHLGYPSPSPLSNIYGLNKVLTRCLVDDFEWFFGFNLDDDVESWIKNVKSYPCMMKATMLSGGRASFRCNDEASLRSSLDAILSDNAMCRMLKESHSDAVKILGSFKEAEKFTQYMVEEFITTKGTTTRQFCMEAFVTENGKVIPYSLVEELFFTNGVFIGHIIPPVHFDGDFQACDDYIIDIGKKLYQLGFKNQAFNIEFWRFSDGKFRLIEINPRCATPYYILYMEYSGNNLLNDVSSLFLHGKEPASTPLSKLKEQWSSGKSDKHYTISADLASVSLGKASELFNFDLLDQLSSEGTMMYYLIPRDHVLTKMNQTASGTLVCSYILKGSWNDMVRNERDIRKRFYKDFSQCEEAKEYPEYFVEA